VCKFLRCLPSELYEKHNPSMADMIFINAMIAQEQEEEREQLEEVTR
jgi:hypothetical protein